MRRAACRERCKRRQQPTAGPRCRGCAPATSVCAAGGRTRRRERCAAHPPPPAVEGREQAAPSPASVVPTAYTARHPPLMAARRGGGAEPGPEGGEKGGLAPPFLQAYSKKILRLCSALPLLPQPHPKSGGGLDTAAAAPAAARRAPRRSGPPPMLPAHSSPGPGHGTPASCEPVSAVRSSKAAPTLAHAGNGQLHDEHLSMHASRGAKRVADAGYPPALAEAVGARAAAGPRQLACARRSRLGGR